MRIMPNQLENMLREVQQTILMNDKRITKLDERKTELLNFRQELVAEQERLLKEKRIR